MITIRLFTLLLFVLLTAVALSRTDTKVNTDYYPAPQPDMEISKVKVHLAELLKNGAEIYTVDVKKNLLGASFGTLKEVFVLDDRIELKFKNQNKILYFEDIFADTISASEQGYVHLGTVSVFLGKKADVLADNLNFIRHHHLLAVQQRCDSLITIFKPIASQYRELKVKPPVSEEQRKFIVQANLFNQQKNYLKAIQLYFKAITIDQTAYPAAYTNLALLSAQIGKFDDAIYYMKKYLLLEPEASDARGAQDKIYEWEAQMKN